MGRKSKLTDDQRAEIERRLIAGEKAINLAAEFGVHRSQITRRVAQHAQQAKVVANQLFEAEESFKSLPVAQQASALNALESLRTMTHHLGGAGSKASAIAHRLTAIAATEMEKVDDADPMAGIPHLKSVSTLMNLAKEAAHIPLNLLAANKDRMKGLEEAPPDAPKPVAGLTAQDAARVYQDFISAG